MADEGTRTVVDNAQQGAPDKTAVDTQKTAGPDPFAELDADTREWIEKRGLKSPAEVAKTAREQASLLGNAIRVPGKDAKPEEIDAYLNKLGRPEKPDGYGFAMPKDLPEGLPYDEARAKDFAALAHQLGLTKAQAGGLHDWATKNAVGDFGMAQQNQREQVIKTAQAATDGLTKLWGPLDGETAKANLAFADRALQLLGGEAVLAEMKSKGMLADVEGRQLVLSVPFVELFAKVGRSLYKEGDVVRGDPTTVDNPFDRSKENLTQAAQIVKNDKDRAYMLIRAANRQPEEFGLKSR